LVILLVDIGNSRAKWAVLTDGTVGPQAAVEHSSWGQGDWEREIGRTGATRVVAASVGAPAVRAALVEASRKAIGRPPDFVTATAEAAGVRSGYTNPAQLGIDRWLAVIGAYHRHRAASCVVDVGTAMTVDAVDGTGLHLGGFIVPGPQLMVESLLTSTGDLADRWRWASAADPTHFAGNTRDAIERGCLAALAGLVADSSGRLGDQAGQRPRLVLTGGGAPILLPWLKDEAELVPDLVLQGLARIVESGSIPVPGPASGPGPW
jgi:type III pantothenate kinase